MTVHLQRQVDKLKRMVLDLGDLVLRALDRAVDAVRRGDAQLAVAVIRDDDRIDRQETEVEEECLHTLALHQPVAFDLRYVVATLKANNDLERIGDLAGSIAERAQRLAALPPAGEPPFDLERMAKVARGMLADALDALVNVNPHTARAVCDAEVQVDDMHAQAFVNVQKRIRENPAQTDAMLQMLSVCRSLERIADHARNIAQDVLYTAQGQVARHRPADPRA